MFSSWFTPQPTPEEQLKLWRERLRKERLSLEASNREYDRSEAEAKAEVREFLKIGEPKAARILCGAITALRRARERNLMIQVQLKSVEQHLVQQVAMSKMCKALQVSATAMRAMNALIKVPQLAQVAMEMSREMEKAGFIQEGFLDATMNVEGGEEEEAEADAEVDRILEELAVGIQLPSAVFLQKTAPQQKPVSLKEAEFF